MKMLALTLLKILCIIVYTGLLVLVPDMPNIYTFIINCLGLLLTLPTSALLLSFLNSRPPANKNLINRILALLILILGLAAIRSWFMSFMACFWNPQIRQMVAMYPAISVGLFSIRVSVISVMVAACALSCGRLLLVTYPVVFHKIKPSIGVIPAGALVIILNVLDYTYTTIMCYENNRYTSTMYIFKVEMGIMESKEHNVTLPSPSFPDEELCQIIPFFKMLVISFVLLETARVIFMIGKEYLKMRRSICQVQPTVLKQVNDNQAKTSSSNSAPRRQQVLRRSESFPPRDQHRILLPFKRQPLQDTAPNTVVMDTVGVQNYPSLSDNNRRQQILHHTESIPLSGQHRILLPHRRQPVQDTDLNSVVMDILGVQNSPNSSDDNIRQQVLQHTESIPSCGQHRILSPHRRLSVQETVVMDIAGDQNPPNPSRNTGRAAENIVLAKEVITKQCMRTASIITAFTFVGFCFSLFRIQWSAVALLTVFRLTVYNLVILLVLFDKDVLSYSLNILGL